MNPIWDGLATGAVLDLLAIVAFGLWKVCTMSLRSFRRRRTLHAARGLLRTERPSDDQTWSLEDWDWALREIGTDEARSQMAIHDRLRGNGPWLRTVRNW
ncbi:hypothetical protein MABM_52510 (plasmid) [Mycobacteroides abscessus]|nr:hypothetical protein MABM_52510 [Mycobacteroides abscessus]